MAKAIAVNQPKAPEEEQELKTSRYGYNQGKNQASNPKSQCILLKVEKQVKVKIVRILSYFQ